MLEKMTIKTGKRMWAKPACTCGLLILFMAICWCNAMQKYATADFVAINGTFQNFNPIRRLLAGQIPYKDFVDYLGMGHLYIGVLMTKLMGGSYSDSLVAFQFLSFLSFGMVFCVLGYVITRKLRLSLAITNLVLIFVLCGYRLGILTSRMYVDAVTVGNSARFIRSMILPLVCVLYILGMRAVPKMNIVRRSVDHKYWNLILAIGLGVVGGIAFVWSNDYGISCWVCLVIMTVFSLFFRTKSIKATLIYSIANIVVSFVTIFVVVQIFTLGHFSEWLDSIFGTGSYQSWYYNSAKSYYIFDIDLSKLRIIQALVTLVYLFMLWRCRGSAGGLLRFGIPALANMVGFCAANEYKLLSGDRAAEMADTILYATILFEVVCLGFLICKSWRAKKILIISSMIASVVATILWLGYEAKVLLPRITNPEATLAGTYVPQLDGNVTERYEDLIAADEFLAGEDVFSTYASAQELMTDCFQPSNVDYIIHVLGDEAREEYLEAFQNGDFRYTSTIKDTYSSYESWVKKSNWFFYRELYQNWHKVFSNQYQVYWERNEHPGENTIILDDVDVSVEFQGEDAAKIIIKTDPTINGTADVLLDYAIKDGDNWLSKLVFTRMLNLNDENPTAVGMSDWNLREASREYVPVDIRDGVGQLELKSAPKGSTKLEIYEVSCERVFVVDLTCPNMGDIG